MLTEQATKRRFKVKLGSEEFTIIGKDSPEHMNAVLKIANEQYEQLKHLQPNLSDSKIATLLAINAISDQLKLQDKLNQIQESE